MGADILYLQIPLECAAGAAARRYVTPPAGEAWKLTGPVSLMPNATTADHGSNNVSIQAFKGASTALTSARTTASDALTQGTLVNLTTTAAGDDLEFSSSKPFSVRVAHSGSGAVVDGMIVASFERMRV